MLFALGSLRDGEGFGERASQIVRDEPSDLADLDVFVLVGSQEMGGVTSTRCDREALDDHWTSFRTPRALTIRERTSPISRSVPSSSSMTPGVSGREPMFARWANWFRLFA